MKISQQKSKFFTSLFFLGRFNRAAVAIHVYRAFYRYLNSLVGSFESLLPSYGT